MRTRLPAPGVPRPPGGGSRGLASAAILLLSAALLSMRQPRAALAVPGGPDTTFGAGGLVTLGFGVNAEAMDVAVQKDGRIVAAGRVLATPSQYDIALARFTASGQRDPSFGTAGQVTTDFGASEVAYSVAVQKDGRIVVAGTRWESPKTQFVVARYLADGQLDVSFGTGGKVITPFGGDGAQAYAMVLQKDGRIVAAGFAGPEDYYDFALARYTSTGQLDPSFGDGGLAVTDLGGGLEIIRALAVQRDGKIVAAGLFEQAAKDSFALVRYLANGSPDPSFGEGGKVITSFDANAFPQAVAIQKNGRIVAAGRRSQPNGPDFALARYRRNGALDASFGVDGRVVSDLGTNDWGYAVAVQKDRKIVVAGSQYPPGAPHSALARYLPQGGLDPTFGSGGQATAWFAGEAHAVRLQRDGRIVVAGESGTYPHNDFAVARYLAK